MLAAREILSAGRERLAAQHRAGSPGVQVSAALTDLYDEIVLALYEAALGTILESEREGFLKEFALVAVGGYGRCDIAPYSDVDLLILHTKATASQASQLAKHLIQDIYDTGLVAGQSLRTVPEALRLAFSDPSIFTTLLEARYLAGDEGLLAKLQRQFLTKTQWNRRGLLQKIVTAREEERNQFGETVYLLEPNVKRSPGGLRDLQLLRWIGYTRYGHKDIESLHLNGELHQEDRDLLRAAREFLLRVRNELHFHAGQAHDILDKRQQLRIAEVFGYEATTGLLPVERFMQDYFRHSQSIRQIVARFVEGARPFRRLQEWLGPLVSFSLGGEFRVGPYSILATQRGQAQLRQDLTQVLRLVVLASLYNKRIAHRTWKFVRTAVAGFHNEVPAAAKRHFLELLSNPPRLGELLHTLHELGVLEKLIPQYAHARSLLQFNEYHKYTVDEHSLRAVECSTEFAERSDILGQAYRDLRDKWLLHLALLIHDLGKGFAEDHSEVGARMAVEIARSFELDEHDSEVLRFLVHKHLYMSHLAFRRDTSDPNLILKLARDVGSPEVLSMLYVLTCADLSAVGPGVFNDWKGEVLASLYQRTMRHLTGDDPGQDDEHRRADLAAAVQEAGAASEWFTRQIAALPDPYLQSAPPAQLFTELRQLADLRPTEVKTWSRYLPESQTVEYTIGTHEAVASGIFHKLTGALSSQGLQILGADIYTLLDGLVLDRFHVTDPDYAAEPSGERLAEVQAALVAALSTDQPPTFRKIWQSRDKQALQSLTRQPTQFHADNATSDKYTILDIFASDRRGLLYTITRELYELGLNVSLAKIGTYVDQVVDVFYVTDNAGHKILQESRLREIRARVQKAIEALDPSESGGNGASPVDATKSTGSESQLTPK
ncbi:MAG: [protein-PII] uridylyltransferase [Pirellulales bacterium]|nr:[protein-PII] uridylyltransferase [Pirellulales bacterium]